MKTGHSILFVFVALTMSSCLPVMSTVLEDASTIKQGNISLQGSCSANTGYQSDEGGSKGWGLRNLNAGFAVRYGLKDQLNLGVRYEHFSLKDRMEFIQGPLLSGSTGMDYFESSLKWSSRDNNEEIYFAVILPVGLYRHPDASIPSIAPTMIISDSWNEKIDMSFQVKLHAIYYDDIIQPNLTLGFGMGFSTDLDRWAIRPEIASNLFNVSFGLGYTRVIQMD